MGIAGAGSPTGAARLSQIDPSTDPRHRSVRKLPMPVWVSFALSAGTLETTEGPVPYEAGDAILTGVKGEKWPVQRDRFFHRYQPTSDVTAGEAGRYSCRPEVLLAVQLSEADAPLEVRTSAGGLLTGTAGDWLVRYGPDDLAVLSREVFDETYEQIG